MKKNIAFGLLAFIVMGCASQRGLDTDSITIQTSPKNAYRSVEIEFIKGEAFNHPSFAIWTENLEGNYIETLYVTQYVAKGQYGHGETEPGRWKNEPGEARHPATLPYWAHKRGIQPPDRRKREIFYRPHHPDHHRCFRPEPGH